MNVSYSIIVGANSYRWLICYFSIVYNGGTVISLDV